MPDIRFDHYYTYAELTELLHGFAADYPALVTLSSLGKSYEGRDIWLATVSAGDTPPEQKPAVWADGNIHATEVSAASACMYLLNRLVTQYGSDPAVTHTLDTRAFYICPRVNPDGAELLLSARPRQIRSSTRPYPYDEEIIEGFVAEDVDGDGRLLYMRVPDANGTWKTSDADPRLMVRRAPTETGGVYYRILPEGRIEGYDGVTFSVPRSKEGLDLNRNFPAKWRHEGEQPGAGPYPVSEPEVRAVVDFIARHNNITSAVAFHTWSGVLLRPYDTQADEAFPAEDLWTYQKIGAKGTELTGYPAISVFHEFRYHPKDVITGTFDEWVYENLGVFGWTVEIWSPQRQAGIKEYKYIEWAREHPLADDLTLLRWSDDALDGKGYVAWYPFDHPQLGRVEIGGWNMLYCWRNPPPHLLEAEIAPFSDWLLWQAQITPRLELHSTQVQPLGDGVYHVQVVGQNTGWLPSYVTKKALEKKLVRGVVAEIALPDGAALHSGRAREVLGQLEGRAYTASAATPWSLFFAPGTSDRVKVEWVVYAPQGGSVTVTLRHERAGVVRTTLALA